MIPSPDDVKAAWNEWSDVYSRRYERNNVTFAISLSSMLQIFEEKPAKILEVACGSGVFSRYLAQNVEHGCELTAIDISEEMIARAKSFSTKFPSMPNIKVSYEAGDAENLSKIADESVDVYIANFCLHLVSDPKKMLQELKRVLKKGKRFGVSVLGPSEKVTMLSALPPLLKQLAEEIPALKPEKEMRSLFYMGNKEDLVKLIEDAGLEVDYCWYQRSSFNCMTVEDYESFLLETPNFKNLIGKLNEEERKRVLEAARKRLKEAFVDQKEPGMNEGLLLVGRKP